MISYAPDGYAICPYIQHAAWLKAIVATEKNVKRISVIIGHSVYFQKLNGHLAVDNAEH